MFKKICRESIREILEHPSLVRFYFFLWFRQNIFVLYILVYRIFDIVNSHYHLFNWHIPSIFALPIQLIQNNLVRAAIFLSISIFFGHFIGYVIAINSVIFRLEDKKYNRSRIFWNFFSTVVLEWIFDIASTSFVLYYAIQLDTPSILLWIVVGLVLLTLEIFHALTPFAQYIVLLEDLWSDSPEKKVGIAITRSINLVWANIGTTIKFTILQILLRIRVLFNLAIAIGVPTGIWYLLYESAMLPRETTIIIVWSLWTILLLFIMYIDAFIDVFFITFRYKLYKFLLGKDVTWD